MKRGQTPIAITIGGFLVSALAFIGGGTFLSKGSAEVKADVAVLKNENANIKEDISEIKGDLKDMKIILNAWAQKNGIGADLIRQQTLLASSTRP